MFYGIQHSQDNQIGGKAVKKIAEALKINCTLTTLCLGVNFFF